jgi:hypothetical protein
VVKLYVEGGGDTNLLRTECRQGFSEFLKKAGLKGHMPKIVACGSRKDAFDAFCTALKQGEHALLLIDSEDQIENGNQQGEFSAWKPWQHLAQRAGDQWKKPENSTHMHCHLMAQCMESWFLADRETLQDFFGNGFKVNSLPPKGNLIEKISKNQVYQSLSEATKDCKTKSPYGKGKHSFKLLASIDPQKITAASGWAKRFIEEMKRQMGC